MTTTALTAKYRPQTFADVAGQQTLKSILSRAAAESRVAAAYLFSGTRGVGKTTVARIFAKALNCRKGPGPEPCNECDLCRAVTAGVAVDVIEIDGASNRGIDDVRRLKEVVGYAPMEGRYKVFIIDEAHMLSRDAFNALLKTLEEPPAGVTFIMATTEPHKFPATIISRCQHYVFKSLPEGELQDHLRRVLTRESVVFEERAIRLIARRGAGSVRDAMSLLGQVLALGGKELSEESVRSVLGLAGQEAFLELVKAIQEGNSLALVRLLREFLDQGLDIGFFLRELAGLWRNLFLLRQSGEAALPAVDTPQEEAHLLLSLSGEFSLAHIHACWQMTLEGQRRVQTSLEPGLALELLLLNLAMLPRLMPLDALSSLVRKAGGGQSGNPGGESTPGSSGNAGSAGKPAGQGSSGSPSGQGVPPGNFTRNQAGNVTGGSGVGLSDSLIQPQVASELPFLGEENFDLASEDINAALSQGSGEALVVDPLSRAAQEKDEGPLSSSSAPLVVEGAGPFAVAPSQAPPPESRTPAGCAPLVGILEQAGGEEDEEDEEDTVDSLPTGTLSFTPPDSSPGKPTWNDIVQKTASLNPPAWFSGLANSVVGRWQGDVLVLNAVGGFAAERLLAGEGREILTTALQALMGTIPPLEMAAVGQRLETREALRQKIFDLPSVQALEVSLGAKILDFGQFR